MKKGFAIGFGIFGTIALLFGALIFMFIRGYVKASNGDVYESMTAEQQKEYGYKALYPELAPCFERYAKKGLRDAVYEVETYQYNSLDEMYEALPEGCRDSIEITLQDTDSEDSKDIKGTSVKRYRISSGLPLLDEDTIPEEYEFYTYGVFHDYYVYEYEDGTYRFATVISTT